ncbi:LPS export ABC transporter permease LptF [Thiorhodovibrio frisius]|uniref:Lipopolysaccharide export system permease protein LptF n=1 Tax=Thiorhodovibrio frisius TaxID=631362 RepID=H8Z4I1_9GAMM|nr:LPS export ABC transporter permease LptF [Thiorhodovibrio frisius]EIC20238.1 putative permease [Thiorhodovibrio frisius]WPL20975.1 Lipopolysaccharide export system permease protein LptF [Thiorhodovibrio frisius]
MLTVIDRYVLLEVAKVFTAIIVTLFLITASLFFLRSLEEVNIGALGLDFALRYLNYQLQRDSGYLMPPAFFLAALVALGRMARDSELIALQACGVGPVRMYRALLYLALPLALLTAWLALVLQPEASAKIQMIRKQQGEQATQIAGLQPGRFYEQADGNITFYATRFDDGKRLEEIVLYDRRDDRPRLVLADIGYYRETNEGRERYIVLEHGRRYDGVPGRADFSIGEFDRYQLQLDAPAPGAQARSKRSTRKTADLLGSEDRGDWVEIQHRMASPLAIFALALIAIPLTTVSPRQTGTGRLMLVLVTYFAFYNLQRLAENWFELGISPDWLGSLWYQPLVVVLVFTILAPKSFWIERGRELGWVYKKFDARSWK